MNVQWTNRQIGNTWTEYIIPRKHDYINSYVILICEWIEYIRAGVGWLSNQEILLHMKMYICIIITILLLYNINIILSSTRGCHIVCYLILRAFYLVLAWTKIMKIGKMKEKFQFVEQWITLVRLYIFTFNILYIIICSLTWNGFF